MFDIKRKTIEWGGKTLTLETGRIAYIVLAFGGFLGIGDKLFAIPWAKLDFDPDNHRLLLDTDKETLRNAPGFNKDNWPDMANVEWADGIHAYYGTRMYSA